MNIHINHPNDRPNFSRLYLGGVTFWFSYETCIAYKLAGQAWATVRENDWGPTTGKHMNLVHGDDRRVPSEEFEAQLGQILERMTYRPDSTIEEIRAEFVQELVSA
jgi:hypothetical protein